MKELIDLLAAVVGVRLVKTTPGYTFPKLGVADDQRATPIVTSPQELSTKRALIHAAGKRHYSTKGIDLEPRDTSSSAPSGLASNFAPLSYSKASSLRDLSSIPHDELSTQLHENVHNMFTRVQQKHGPEARKKLAYNLVGALPSKSRAAAEAFSEWKNPSYAGKHEETIANLVSYLNNPGERTSFRSSQFQFYGNTPYRPSGDFPGFHKDKRSRTWDQQKINDPDVARRDISPKRKYKYEAREKDAALKHDQHMKTAHRALQDLAQHADESWTTKHLPYRYDDDVPAHLAEHVARTSRRESR